MQLRRGELFQCGFDKMGRGIVYYSLNFDNCTSDEKVDLMIFSMDRNVREVVRSFFSPFFQQEIPAQQKRTGEVKLTWIVSLIAFLFE